MKFNTDFLTTIFGLTAGVGTATTIDPTKLAAGDFTEIMKIIVSVALALHGYFTNKRRGELR